MYRIPNSSNLLNTVFLIMYDILNQNQMKNLIMSKLGK